MIEQRFRIACARLGLNRKHTVLDTSKFRAPVTRKPQMDLF
jgi:hypothetical protein